MPAAFIISGLNLGTTAFFFASIAASAIDAYLLGAILAPSQSESLTPTQKQTLTIRSASEPHKHIYGRTIVGGTLVYGGVLDRYSLKPAVIDDAGTIGLEEVRQEGGYLNTCIAIAAHEIDAVEEIYLGEDLVFKLNVDSGVLDLVDSRYEGFINLEIGYGAPAQAASARIIANTNKHFYGKDTLATDNTVYYESNGVTTSTATSITIDRSIAIDKLAIDTSYSYIDGDGDRVYDYVSADINGTYPFVPTTYAGERDTGSPEWSVKHKLTNTAYLYLRYKFNSDLYSGIPTPKAVVRGKRLFDPRKTMSANPTWVGTGAWVNVDASAVAQTYAIDDVVSYFNYGTYVCNTAHTTSQLAVVTEAEQNIVFGIDFADNRYWDKVHVNTDSTTWEWSDNWALCLRDYLTSASFHSKVSTDTTKQLYGIGVKDSEISDANIINAANISDESVNLTQNFDSIVSTTWSSGVLSIVLASDRTKDYARYETINLSDNTETIYTETNRYTFPLVVGWVTLAPSTLYYLSYFTTKFSIDSSTYDSATDTTTLLVKSNYALDLPKINLYSSRFTVNGVVDTSVSPINILEDLLSAAGATMPYTQGKYNLVPAVYITPTISLNETNLAGGISVVGSSTSANLVNTITGTIRNPADNWEESDFTKVTSPILIERDGGYELAKSIKLPFTSSNFDAQRLATIMLNRSRQGIAAEMLCNLSALEVPIGSFIKVSNDRLGWVDKEFSVRAWKFQGSSIALSIQEEDIGSYAWNYGDVVTTAYKYNSDLKSFSIPQPATLDPLVSGTATLQKLADGTIVPRVKISWAGNDQPFKCVTVLEVSILSGAGSSPSSELRTIEIKDRSAKEYYLGNVIEGDRVAVTAYGIVDRNNQVIESARSTAILASVLGKSELPTTVTGLAYTIEGTFLSLSWDKNTEIDFKEYEIRKGGTDWATATVIGFTKDNYYLYIPDAFGVTDFRVKAVDTSGNYSAVSNDVNLSLLIPSTVTGFSIDSAVTASTGNFVLGWDAVSSVFPLSKYIIREGISYDDAASVLVAEVSSLSFSIPVQWSSSKTYHIKAVDSLNNSSSGVEASITATANIPQGITSSFYLDRGNLVLSYGYTSSDLPVVEYRLTVGGVLLAEVSASKYTIVPYWAGTANITVEAKNSAGFYSAINTLPVLLDVPQGITGSFAFDADSVLLSYGYTSSDLPVVEYRLKVDGVLLAETSATKYSLAADWVGIKNITVEAMNSSGFYSTAYTIAVSISAPQGVSASYAIKDSNVVLAMAYTSSDIPVIAYEIVIDTLVIAEVDSNTYTIIPNWVGSKDILVRAKNAAGFYSSASTTAVVLSAPSGASGTYKFEEANLVISMTNTSSSLPVVGYRLSIDAVVIAETNSSTYTLVPNWAGNKTISIEAKNTAGFYSSIYSLVVDASVPASPSVSYVFEGNNLVLSMSNSTSVLPVIAYRITIGGVLVSEVDSTSYTMDPYWVGDKSVSVEAKNSSGFYSVATVATVTVVAPNAPTEISVINRIVGNRVEFTWGYTNYLGSLPIASYDISYGPGSTYDDALNTKVLVTGTDSFSRKVDWGANASGLSQGEETRKFWVTPIDSNGNSGTSLTIDVSIKSPGYTSIIPQVIDNNVLLRWNAPTLPSVGSLPIQYYEVRKGDSYDTAEVLGEISALFFSTFELVSASYRYWVTAVDTAGKLGSNNSTNAQVSEPPDFILYDTQFDDFVTNTAFVNSVKDPSGSSLILPIVTGETYQQHFDNNAFTTPNDQVTATPVNFPIYIQPSPSSASYEKIIDYGTVLSNLSVRVDITASLLAGDLVFATSGAARWTVAISINAQDVVIGSITDAWVDFDPGNTKVFAPSFRHVKYVISVVSDSGDDLLGIDSINTIIDIKERNDAGTGSVSTAESDASSGTSVSFTAGKNFVDITSITVTPKLQGINDPIIAIYDFVDIANPTGFTVYLLNTNTGAHVPGNFSWSARGR